MRRMLPALLVLSALAAVPRSVPDVAAQQKHGSISGAANIVRLDPRFDKLVPKDAKLEKIADGFTWVEGPVWDRKGQYLLFSDIPANSVFKWKPGAGVSLFLKPSGYTGPKPFEGKERGANGITFAEN